MKKPSKRLQVRMDPDLLEALREQARNMGYRSAPEYVRAWAVQEVGQPAQSRSIELNYHSNLALRYVELILGALSPQAPNTDTALHYLRRQLAARSWTQHMKEIGFRDRAGDSVYKYKSD